MRLTSVANSLDIQGYVWCDFDGTQGSSSALTTLRFCQVSFLQCCPKKGYTRAITGRFSTWTVGKNENQHNMRKTFPVLNSEQHFPSLSNLNSTFFKNACNLGCIVLSVKPGLNCLSKAMDVLGSLLLEPVPPTLGLWRSARDQQRHPFTVIHSSCVV